MRKSDIKIIGKDIQDQLERVSKYGKYYEDLVDDYMYLIEIREKLKKDVKKKGIRYKFTNGNGIEQEKPNESMANLIKVEQLLLKIISDLGINPKVPSEPQEPPKASDNNAEADLL